MYQRGAELHAPGDIVAHWQPSHSRRSSFRSFPCPRRCSYRATIPCDIHGDFEIFEIFQIACVTTAAVRSNALRIRNQSPQSSSGIGSPSHGSMTSWPHSIVSVAGGPLLCCCCGLARGLLLCLLCTLPALTAHLVGVPAVVTHHLKGNAPSESACLECAA